MATYTQVFASLIARVTPYHSPSLPFYHKAHLLVALGNWRRYEIPLSGSGSPVELFKRRFIVPTRMRVVVHLVFSQAVTGREDYLTFFRVWFPYGWYPRGDDWMCKFLEAPNFIRFQQVPYIIPPSLPRVRARVTPFSTQRATNQQLVHNARVVSSKAYKLSSPAVSKVYGRFSNANPRPNPETRNSSYIGGQEALLFGNQPVPWNGQIFPYQSFNRSYSGVTTPGFRTMKRAKLPENPYHLVLITTDDGQAYHLLDQKVSGQYGTYFSFSCGLTSIYFQFPRPDPTHNEDASNLAIRRAIANAELDLQSNIAQDLAQFGQTTRMIADTATRLRLAITATRKGQFSTAANALFHGKPKRQNNIPIGSPSRTKSLANNWLQMQYGWKPLLMDIDGSMRALANYMVQSPQVRTVRGSATKKTILRGQPTQAGVALSDLGVYEICTSTTVKFGVNYGIDSPLTTFLSQTGFTNPINLVWEILPYSFVVDWFLPIGPYLETLSAWHGTAFVGGFKNSFTRQNITASVYFEKRPDPPNPNNYTRSGRGSFNREWIIHDRAKLLVPPTVSFPTLKNPFSVTHAANGLALLRSAFKR